MDIVAGNMIVVHAVVGLVPSPAHIYGRIRSIEYLIVADIHIGGETYGDGEATPVVGGRVGYIVVVDFNTIANDPLILRVVGLMSLDLVIAEKSGKNTVATDVVECTALYEHITCAALEVDTCGCHMAEIAVGEADSLGIPDSDTGGRTSR